MSRCARRGRGIEHEEEIIVTKIAKLIDAVGVSGSSYPRRELWSVELRSVASIFLSGLKPLPWAGLQLRRKNGSMSD